MNTFFVLIISILFFDFILNNLARVFDLKCFAYELPKEFKNQYSEIEYKNSQNYIFTGIYFSFFTSFLNFFYYCFAFFLGFLIHWIFLYVIFNFHI